MRIRGVNQIQRHRRGTLKQGKSFCQHGECINRGKVHQKKDMIVYNRLKFCTEECKEGWIKNDKD